MATAYDLVTQARVELFDEIIGYDDADELWSDVTLLRYIDKAQNEFAEKTLCFPDNSTFDISIIAGTEEYEYDPRIIEVQGGYLNTSKKRMLVKEFSAFERSYLLSSATINAPGQWENKTGLPKFIIPNLQFGIIRIWPKPVATDTLTLYAYRYPLNQITSLTDNIEVDSQFHEGLLLKVKSLALAKLDADSVNLEQSMLFGQKWQSFVQDAQEIFQKRFNRIRQKENK